VLTLLSYLHEACGPNGERSTVYPHDCEVLLADLMKHMRDRGEVFAPPHVLSGSRYIASAKSRRVAGYENGPCLVTIQAKPRALEKGRWRD
jgi:hypothetical protein